MTWVLVCLVVLAVGGLLAWAAVRQRDHAGDETLEQARSRAHRLGSITGGNGEGGGYPGGGFGG